MDSLDHLVAGDSDAYDVDAAEAVRPAPLEVPLHLGLARIAPGAMTQFFV
jgi:hypothetical protein